MFDPNSQQSTLNQVDDKAQQYMNNPQALQQIYQKNQQLVDLLALQKIKSQKEAAAREMQLQMSQQSGQPQTIAQQREQQVLDMTKQEMIGQQAGNLGHKQQEQQQNLQQVLKGMSQGAPQPPQGGIAGMPQGGQPGMPQPGMPQPKPTQAGMPGIPTPGLMPTKAMASGGIVAFDEGGDVGPTAPEINSANSMVQAFRAGNTNRGNGLAELLQNIKPGYAHGGVIGYSGEKDSYVGLPDWEEEWEKRQKEKAAKGTGEEVPRSWWERNVVNPEENRYKIARSIEANRMERANKSGPFTPQTDRERDAEKAKEAIIANMRKGKYDPTGKPLVPMIGKEKQEDVYARDNPKLPEADRIKAMLNTSGKPPLAAPQAAPQPGLPGALPQPKPQPSPGAAPNLNTAAPAQTMPQAPAVGLPSVLQTNMENAAIREVNRNPQAEAEAYRAKANQAMGYSQKEKDKIEANQAAMEAYDKKMYDPQKMKDEQLNEFFMGAAGRGTIGTTLSGGNRGASTRQRQQELMQREAMGERQAKQEGFLETGRKSREDAFKSGDTALKEAQSGINQGLASGTSMVDIDKQMVSAGLDRESREKIANITAAVQREVNGAMKENTLELKRQSLLSNIDKAEENAVSTARKSSNDYAILKNLAGFEAMGKLDKNQMAQKQAAEAKLEKLETVIRNKFQDTRDLVMSGSGGAGIGSLGSKGWSVTPIKQPK
jgi:hypothetical protein